MTTEKHGGELTLSDSKFTATEPLVGDVCADPQADCKPKTSKAEAGAGTRREK